MSFLLKIGFLTMVLGHLSIALASSEDSSRATDETSHFLDHSLDLTPTPRPVPSDTSEEASTNKISAWDIPSTSKNALGYRWGVSLSKDEEGLLSEYTAGLAFSSYLSERWDIGLSADLIYPPSGQFEIQFQRVFSRSKLKPSLHVGAALRPRPERQLAFLVDGGSYLVVAGFAMQDEWTESAALKIEGSILANGEVVCARVLVYFLTLL